MPVDVGGIKIGGEHVIRENLFRHYTCLDPNSPGGNTTWNDISGNNQDDSGGVGATLDGYYYDFDGTDDVFQFPTLSFTENTAYSMELWIKFDSLASNRGGIFMVGLTTDSYGFDQSGGLVRWGIRPSSTLFKVTNEPATNTWHHYLGTYDGGGNSGVLTLYREAVLIGTATNTHTSLSTSEVLQLGDSNIMGGSTSGATHLNGKVAVARVYNRELTHDEVIYNYNAERGAFGV